MFTYNERTDYYEAMDGGHSIYLDADVFMHDLEMLVESGYSEAEALDEVNHVDYWYKQIPLSGLFIDRVEQNDLAEFSKTQVF